MVENESSRVDRASQAYSVIKRSIRLGELGAGHRMVEKELTEQLGMSRTPVREALQQLKSEGLLTSDPGAGLVVTRPDHQMVMELYDMREVLEARAAGLAAQHASELEISSLRELIEREADYLHDAKELSLINERFHGLMYLAAHNRYLLRSLQSMNDTLCLLPTLLDAEDRALESHQEHLRIIDAIERHSSKESSDAMQIHIKSAQRRRIQWLVTSGVLEQDQRRG